MSLNTAFEQSIMPNQPLPNIGMWQNADFLTNIEMLASQILDPVAIDKGYYPVKQMGELAKLGAFAPHLNSQGNDFFKAILSTAKIAQTCGTTGFLAWCHQVCGLYLDQSDNTALKQRYLTNHTLGMTFGGTALSNPMKAFVGIESMILRGKKVDGGYVISGTLPWISHIAPNQYCGAIASIVQGDVCVKDIFFLLVFDDARKQSWQLNPCPAFGGMEGSSTWQIVLNDYFVPTDDIIADPAMAFIQKVRGAFVLMQFGIGAGIIQGAIMDILVVQKQLGFVNQFLQDQAGALQQSLDKLLDNAQSLATMPLDTDKQLFLDILDLRIQVTQLSLKATQASLLHQGAKGYLLSANPQRRIREAQFVAIVTPAIKHLRYLSHQLMSEVSPQ